MLADNQAKAYAAVPEPAMHTCTHTHRQKQKGWGVCVLLAFEPHVHTHTEREGREGPREKRDEEVQRLSLSLSPLTSLLTSLDLSPSLVCLCGALHLAASWSGVLPRCSTVVAGCGIKAEMQ